MVTAEEDAHASAVLSKAKAENFPVAPRFLPRAWRDDLMAVYGFARLVDDIGDGDLGASGPAHASSLGLAPGQAADPLAMLDAFEADVHRVFDGISWGGPSPTGTSTGRSGPGHPLLRALVPTVRRRGLTPEPFLALIEANRQDQKVRRYATYAELLAYCELSANPVGRLVLAITGTMTPERVRRSDAVCTGLQIIEHLQDVAEDLARDRIYLPAEDLARFRVGESDLAAPTANASVRALIAYETERALGLLDEGAPLARSVHGRLRLLLAGFTGGGRAAASALRAARYDVLAGTPRAGTASVLRESWASLRGEG
ncbi:squalene synthase HpnC [Streptomyces oryzae]|uniref:Squalene synthase HpnC n=1 Tax=Streptomyces oryzae TaxID=1434886 RepID=A0ABS3XCQ6_9ACTN|nr:squalene synthase HpnC [Streptomyces oryzae]MBO8193111.1 squalene synthase HpnC [Streptomyces oryzae]